MKIVTKTGPMLALLAAGWLGAAEARPTPESALARLGRGDAAGARSEYEQLLSRRPSDARLAFNAGLAAYGQGDWEGAARHFESALGSADLGLQQRAFFNLGNTRFRQGEGGTDPADKARVWEDAVRQYQAALGLNPVDGDTQANLERVRQELARLPKPPEEEKKEKKDKDKNQDKDKQKKDGDQSEKSDPSDKSEGSDKQEQQEPKEGQNQQKDQQKDQQGQQGQDKQDGQKGEEGQKGKDGKDGKDGEKSKGSKGDPKDERDDSEGEEGSNEAAKDRDSQKAKPGSAAGGADAGEEAPEGQMAVRFAERLLDQHKKEERALIWRPEQGRGREQPSAGGRRKKW